jgi:hypothetical protein
MSKKLTLSLDNDVIDFAHSYAQETKTSVSKIVEYYLMDLQGHYMAGRQTAGLPRDLDELYGTFAEIPAPDKKDLRRMFHEDHRN